jgi:hypothetical protein
MSHRLIKNTLTIKLCSPSINHTGLFISLRASASLRSLRETQIKTQIILALIE